MEGENLVASLISSHISNATTRVQLIWGNTSNVVKASCYLDSSVSPPSTICQQGFPQTIHAAFFNYETIRRECDWRLEKQDSSIVVKNNLLLETTTNNFTMRSALQVSITAAVDAIAGSSSAPITPSNDVQIASVPDGRGVVIDYLEVAPPGQNEPTTYSAAVITGVILGSLAVVGGISTATITMILRKRRTHFEKDLEQVSFEKVPQLFITPPTTPRNSVDVKPPAKPQRARIASQDSDITFRGEIIPPPRDAMESPSTIRPPSRMRTRSGGPPLENFHFDQHARTQSASINRLRTPSPSTTK